MWTEETLPGGRPLRSVPAASRLRPVCAADTRHRFHTQCVLQGHVWRRRRRRRLLVCRPYAPSSPPWLYRHRTWGTLHDLKAQGSKLAFFTFILLHNSKKSSHCRTSFFLNLFFTYFYVKKPFFRILYIIKSSMETEQSLLKVGRTRNANNH